MSEQRWRPSRVDANGDARELNGATNYVLPAPTTSHLLSDSVLYLAAIQEDLAARLRQFPGGEQELREIRAAAFADALAIPAEDADSVLAGDVLELIDMGILPPLPSGTIRTLRLAAGRSSGGDGPDAGAGGGGGGAADAGDYEYSTGRNGASDNQKKQGEALRAAAGVHARNDLEAVGFIGQLLAEMPLDGGAHVIKCDLCGCDVSRSVRVLCGCLHPRLLRLCVACDTERHRQTVDWKRRVLLQQPLRSSLAGERAALTTPVVTRLHPNEFLRSRAPGDVMDEEGGGGGGFGGVATPVLSVTPADILVRAVAAAWDYDEPCACGSIHIGAVLDHDWNGTLAIHTLRGQYFAGATSWYRCGGCGQARQRAVGAGTARYALVRSTYFPLSTKQVRGAVEAESIADHIATSKAAFGGLGMGTLAREADSAASDRASSSVSDGLPCTPLQMGNVRNAIVVQRTFAASAVAALRGAMMTCLAGGAAGCRTQAMDGNAKLTRFQDAGGAGGPVHLVNPSAPVFVTTDEHDVLMTDYKTAMGNSSSGSDTCGAGTVGASRWNAGREKEHVSIPLDSHGAYLSWCPHRAATSCMMLSQFEQQGDGIIIFLLLLALGLVQLDSDIGCLISNSLIGRSHRTMGNDWLDPVIKRIFPAAESVRITRAGVGPALNVVVTAVAHAAAAGAPPPPQRFLTCLSDLRSRFTSCDVPKLLIDVVEWHAQMHTDACRVGLRAHDVALMTRS